MANKEKMTKREFLTAVLAMEGVTADVAEFAQAEVAKLDAVNEKRRNTPSKKDVENAPIMETLARNNFVQHTLYEVIRTLYIHNADLDYNWSLNNPWTIQLDEPEA